jgi:SAM-dependent methyltransferase
MISLKDYWDQSFSRPNLQLQVDDWLSKYEEILKGTDSIPIIDLGSGLGNNTKYLLDRNYPVLSCDVSEIALSKLAANLPNAQLRHLDMQEGLPFPDSSHPVIVADLSLHYFSNEMTFQILRDIHRILSPGGVLLCRVNSIKNLAEPAYFIEVGGIYRRYFDRSQIDFFFLNTQWEIIRIEEYAIDRYSLGKNVWEISMRKMDEFASSQG